MEFCFPDWSTSLHDPCLQAAAKLAKAAPVEQLGAWQHTDLIDLSGDEVRA